MRNNVLTIRTLFQTIALWVAVAEHACTEGDIMRGGTLSFWNRAYVFALLSMTFTGFLVYVGLVLYLMAV